jgi:site-specific recombinase XerD
MAVNTQRTYKLLSDVIDSFISTKNIEGRTPGTIHFYRVKLSKLLAYYGDKPFREITFDDLRVFFQDMFGIHNPGGYMTIFRSVRALFNYYEFVRLEPYKWKNPMHLLRPMRLDDEPLEPATKEDINALIKVCGKRDSALVYVLADTGIRSGELLRMLRTDYNPIDNEILIRQTKSRQPRTVFLSPISSRAVKSYLRTRTDNEPYLWLSEINTPLTYDGLRGVITRRAKEAGIKPIPLHAFRRFFCLQMLRSGCDISSLSKLAGWKSLSVASRYLRQTNEDVRLIHRLHSPVDSL